MTVQQALARPLMGIIDLCRFRPEGLARFDFSWQGFWQSWAALPFAAAPYAINSKMFTLLAAEQGMRSISLWQSVGVFAAAWVVYAWLFILVTRWLLLRNNALATLMVLNWLRLFKQLLVLPVLLLAGAGALPLSLLNLLYLGIGLYLLSVEVFILRTALGATLIQAIGFVILNVLMGLLLMRGVQFLLS